MCYKKQFKCRSQKSVETFVNLEKTLTFHEVILIKFSNKIEEERTV